MTRKDKRNLKFDQFGWAELKFSEVALGERFTLINDGEGYSFAKCEESGKIFGSVKAFGPINLGGPNDPKTYPDQDKIVMVHKNDEIA